MQDTASHGAPKVDADELRHTLSVHDVGAQLEAAGEEALALAREYPPELMRILRAGLEKEDALEIA